MRILPIRMERQQSRRPCSMASPVGRHTVHNWDQNVVRLKTFVTWSRWFHNALNLHVICDFIYPSQNHRCFDCALCVCYCMCLNVPGNIILLYLLVFIRSINFTEREEMATDKKQSRAHNSLTWWICAEQNVQLECSRQKSHMHRRHNTCTYKGKDSNFVSEARKV